ncbi:MAG: Wzz/FepE/Etk N-terminal domain-containing protein [Gemmatimonadaceae bacterium]
MTTPRPRSTEPLTVSAPVEPIRPEAIRPEPSLDSDEFSVISLINTVLRHRWWILLFGLLGAAYMAYKTSLMPRLYTTEAQFIPKGSRGQSQLQGIAAQFGLAVGGGDATQSPAFYVDLLDSRPLLASVADQQFRVRTDSGLIVGNLATIYGIKNKNPDVVKSSVVNRLKGQVDQTSSVRTGVITVTVHAKYPELAVQIARAVLDQVNIFNLNRRQEQAAAERQFIEGRLADAQAQLSQAENNQEAFLTENRDFRSSPTLMLEYDRLNRKVNERQTVYNSLATAYEQAKIEEVRDLPVITVLEPPELPILPDPRGGKRRILIGVIAGLLLGTMVAFGRDRLAVNRNVHSDEYAEFGALKQSAVSDIRHPWRRVSRLFASRART